MITRFQDESFAALLPDTKEEAERYYDTVRAAANVMLDSGVPEGSELEREDLETSSEDGFDLYKLIVGRKGAKEQVPVIALVPPDFTGEAVLWIHQRGKAGLFDEKGKPQDAVQELLDSGYAVVGTDVFLTGEFVADGEKPKYPAVDEKYAGYTFGYNRPVLANRVRDILTVIGTLTEDENVGTIHMIGTGEAGTWALLARALTGKLVDKSVVEVGGFGFGNVKSLDDPMLLPGALRYGGLGGLAALAAPNNLVIAGTEKTPEDELSPLQKVYSATGGKLTLIPGGLNMKQAADRLMD